MSSDETPRPPETAEFAHVVPGGPAHAYPAAGQVSVTKFSVGRWDNNVYVIACDGDAIIVDGAGEPERILDEVRGHRVTSIVQTHNHPDHTGALGGLVEELGVPVLAHPSDPMPVPTEALADGQLLPVGTASLKVMHTPGHTPGSTCFLLDEHLFSGDTLFPAGPGNTDRDPERFARIMGSLDRLFELPDGTRVSPGHGVDTFIGRERPHLDVWRTRGW